MARSRAETNAIAARRAGDIAAGVAGIFAEQWGPGSRTVTIRELPSMVIRSTWVVGPKETDPASLGMHEVWRELGDGSYLMTMSQGPVIIHAVVAVDGDQVDVENVTPSEAALLPELAKLVEEESS